MAGQTERALVLWLLLFVSLVFQTKEFELSDEDWEDLPASLVSLHRLRGLHNQFTRETKPDAHIPLLRSAVFQRRLGPASRQLSDSESVTLDENTERDIFEVLKGCQDLPQCFLQKEQDFKGFLVHVEEQKLQDSLLSASEWSYTYRNKVLLLMDEEAETLQRAEEEFQGDPLNSMKVGQSCLYNVSCFTTVNTDTVVRIFGCTSKDSLSKYGGSTLAAKLLQTKLKSASLFSIDGNTSDYFQINFMRVFKTHGLSAILETNKQDYKILDHNDLVVKYTPKISPRGMDPTTQYDTQSILIMEDDRVVRQAATFLYEKHPTVTSVYMLDQNGHPKLIKGDPSLLSQDSRLVLVGHGRKGSDGETRLSGYRPEKVGEIISSIERLGGEIKTTSVVACEVGADESFITKLLNELHARSVHTELHLRSSILQVSNSGEKVTVEITPSGLEVMRHKDDSKKVIAWRTEDGKTTIKIEPNSKGKEIFSNEKNFLGDIETQNIPPAEPKKFVNQNIRESHTDVLESLAWAFFGNRDVSNINRPKISSDFQYVIKEMDGTPEHILHNSVVEQKLKNGYEIKSSEDILNLITRFAYDGDNRQDTYIMLRDWIFFMDPENLYIYPVGKRLNNNEIGDNGKIEMIKNSIVEQKDKHTYRSIHSAIQEKSESDYGKFVRETLYNPLEIMKLAHSTEAWFCTCFLASVMSESARNFRTFPLITMAVDMTKSGHPETVKMGLEFLLKKHPMARGGTWMNKPQRGFYGSSDVPTTGLKRRIYKLRRESLVELIKNEGIVYNAWLGEKEFTTDLARHLIQYVHSNQILEPNFQNAIQQYSDAINRPQRNQEFSGALGGSTEGAITGRDLHVYANVEQSMKLSSHYSRSSAVLSEEIQNHLQKQFGESLKDFVFKHDSIQVKEGDCYFEVVSKKNPHEKYSAKVKLPEEGQVHMDEIRKSMESISEMEIPEPGKTHMGSKHLERAGMAMGVMGLMLGARGAVESFERGDIEHGVMGTLQTAHGATGLSMAVLGKKLAVTKNTKVIRTINTVLRNPVSKVALRVLPVVGIGFGIYSLVEDFKRGDALGYIGAGFDSVMLVLDVVELAVPALAPIIVPLNLAISAIRMLFDDVYLSIESELRNLPPDAGVLDKIGAFFRGLGKGILHFALDVISFFYTVPYREIEEGRRLVEQISDYRKYYSFREVQANRKAIDFTGGEMSMSGGGITFCLSDNWYSTFCMDYFVSSRTTLGKKCWTVDTSNTKDIILGIGESQQLQYSTIQLKVLLFIPAGSIDVVSGYKVIPNTRYGYYEGNNQDNNFFAVQTNTDEHIMEIMLSYYYRLYGKSGDDTFFLGPQKSYVEGQGGRDTYVIPSQGGSTVINNYDPVKTMDMLVFSVNFRQLNVRKSGNDVILNFLNTHNVRILNWFVGEEYRHINMMSEDGVAFDISSAVVSSVKLVAQSINMMSKTEGQRVDASQHPLNTVINVFGSAHNDQLTGNAENNFIDGGGGSDTLRGKEGEDVYMIKKRANSAVSIENYSSDNKQDMVLLEAKIRDITVRVFGDHVTLTPFADRSSPVTVTLLNWFRSEADRHLVIVTEDFITFTVSTDRSSCMTLNPFTSKCILIGVLDYSKSKNPLQVDLEGDEVYEHVTEVRGSDFNDIIRGNSQQNIIVTGKGTDFLCGRGGNDWYVVTPGYGLKTIDNYSPDLAADMLYIREGYEFIKCKCDGENLKLLINGTEQVFIKGWFGSIMSQHLQIQSSDGVTFNLPSNTFICELATSLTSNTHFQRQMDSQMFNKMNERMTKDGIKQSTLLGPCSYDADESDGVLEVICRASPSSSVFRNAFAGQEKFQDHGCPYADQPLFSSGSMGRRHEIYQMVCKYSLNLKYPQMVDNRQKTSDSHTMFMNQREFVSVLELFGSSGFVDMTGNAKDNKLDSYLGGGLMAGLDGIDTYVVKSEYGTNIEIDNLSKDMKEDRVLLEADFFSGSLTVLSEGYNVLIRAKNKGHDMQVRLHKYHLGEQYQHLSFVTSDGVHFRLGYLEDANPKTMFIKAYKVKMENEWTDCRMDLNAHANLSAIHTVQGCPQQSNSIEGNDLDNALTGGVKVDMINGGPGHDTLMGGRGNDILLGGSGDDTLYGEEGDDTMMGGPGSDAFIPGPGADLMDGGEGRDTVFYQGNHSTGEGVYINLLTGECRQADAEGDVLKDVENVVGTIYSDILVAGYEPTLLKGSDGNDVLVSQAGKDYLIGGDGSDVYMMVFPRDTVIIDNCADDNATDVLYLRSMSADTVLCSQTNTSLTLSFRDEAKVVNVELNDWIIGSGTCRHLLVILKEGETTVEVLQHKCKANAEQM
ncbi:uncharacterized protein LOC134071203 [Sardina pilchardus]|uniref:uncharacterized protein LOC134071203 n=1 Tax=Sardina pilchardus TaxID=27697 RepID=UPI002E0F8EDA